MLAKATFLLALCALGVLGWTLTHLTGLGIGLGSARVLVEAGLVIVLFVAAFAVN